MIDVVFVYTISDIVSGLAFGLIVVGWIVMTIVERRRERRR